MTTTPDLYLAPAEKDQIKINNVIRQLIEGRLTSTSGSGLVTATGGTEPRSLQDHLGDDLYVEDFGAVGNGSTDDTVAIQAAIDAAIAIGGGTVYFGAKTYRFTSTLTIDGSYVTLRGSGEQATILQFVPTANDTAIYFDGTAGSIWFCGIYDLLLYSSNTTFEKVAIDLFDVRGFTGRRIQVAGASSGPGGTNCFGGGAAGSIGIRVDGREFVDFDSSNWIAADRPLYLASSSPVGGIDHSRFHATLVADNFPCIEVADNFAFGNTTFGGSWNGGTYGFYWVNSTVTIASIHLQFRDIRIEQAQDSTKENFYIDTGAAHPAQGVFFQNVRCDFFREGIYLRNIAWVGLTGTNYFGASPQVAVDWDNSVESVSFIDCVFTGDINKGAGVNTVYETPTVYGSGSPASAHYSTVSSQLAVGTLVGATSESLTFLSDGNLAEFRIQNDDDGVDGAALAIYGNSGSPANSDVVGSIIFKGNNSTGATANYAQITSSILDKTAGAEYGLLNFYFINGGSLSQVSLSVSGLFPNGSSLSLGAGAAPWTHAFLGGGGTLNFNNGDVVLTHSTNTLTFTGASSGYVFDATIKPSANDGAALGVSGTAFSDLFLASGGVINWNASALTLTQSGASLIMAGAAAGGTVLQIQNTDDGATGGNLTFFHDSQSPAANDNIGRIDFSGRDSAGPPGNSTVYGSFRCSILSPTDGAETATFLWSLQNGSGTNTAYLALINSALRPNTNDLIGLGTATVAWSDLFLASGAVINFNNGDVTLTHSSGALALSDELRIAGDTGGAASHVTFTGTSDISANSTGTGTIKFKGASNRDSTGFIKIYIGTTAYYLPAFSAITG